jgi:hypothetical protein
MKNKKLQKLVEEMLGVAAAEPVHTNEKPEEHTPEVENKDILVGQHAEEVEEVIVEGEEIESKEHKEIADAGEYDYEGDMAKGQLRVVIDAAQELHDKLGDQDNLPEWVQSKITLAKEYIDTARDYMKSEHKEEELESEKEMVVESEHVDYEGKMAKSQLKSIIKHAQELHDKLEDDSQLPAWVQDKLSLADHNIEASNSYHEEKEPVQESYTREELEELFEALNLDTHKYTFEFLAEELGFAAAEPVHTEEKPEEHTPEVENKDILVGQHAEEVKEVIVESKKIAPKTSSKKIDLKPVLVEAKKVKTSEKTATSKKIDLKPVLVEGMRGRPSFKSLRVAPKGSTVVDKNGTLEKVKKLQKKG